jgi:hypothetical protein
MECRELAPVPSRVGLVLQYRKDRPTSPLINFKAFCNVFRSRFSMIFLILAMI